MWFLEYIPWKYELYLDRYCCVRTHVSTEERTNASHGGPRDNNGEYDQQQALTFSKAEVEIFIYWNTGSAFSPNMPLCLYIWKYFCRACLSTFNDTRRSSQIASPYQTKITNHTIKFPNVLQVHVDYCHRIPSYGLNGDIGAPQWYVLYQMQCDVLISNTVPTYKVEFCFVLLWLYNRSGWISSIYHLW